MINCPTCAFADFDRGKCTRLLINLPHICPYAEERKPKTNGDKIRAMSDEELAFILAWPSVASPPWCSEHLNCPYISEDPTPCDKCALAYLRQEVEE